MSSIFTTPRYTVRKKFFSLVGAKFHVYGPDETLLAFSEQKAFKLKEDIRIYTDESMSQELLCINARSVIDFSASYDVMDSSTGEKVGVLQRKGQKSMFKDEWIMKNKDEQELGLIKETVHLWPLSGEW